MELHLVQELKIRTMNYGEDNTIFLKYKYLFIYILKISNDLK